MFSKKFLFVSMLLLMVLCSLFSENVVSISIEPLTIKAGESGIIKATYTIPETMHQTYQEDYFYFDIEAIDGVIFSETTFPEGVEEHGVINYYDSVTLSKKFTVSNNVTVTSLNLKVLAGYQFCFDSGACDFPEEEEINIELKVTPGTSGTSASGWGTTLKFLMFAFLGGVILNVMPCVLPVLSIKAMSIVKQSQQDKKQILRSSMAYTFGILVSFVIMALAIIILKASGEMVGWGFQFQNTGFVLSLLVVMFVFSLSLFDIFTFSPPGMQTATKASSKGGLTGSFMSGVFAVLLATPCTAPLLAPALGFAFSQPPLIILGMFLLIGVGLAFPFILLGFWPKAIKLIPKPGNWMNTFKELMGFLLLATSLFLLRTLSFLVGGENLINVIWFLLIVALAAWIFGRWTKPHIPKKKQWIATILALFIAVGGGFATLNFDSGSSSEASSDSHLYPEGWQKFSPELVDQYRSEGKPVFIDFGAEWCMTCKTNEKTVLFTKDIQEAFKNNNVELLRGDNTKRDDVIGEWLRRFKRAGVPLYIFYYPGSDEPVVLPELITKDMVYKMLEENL